MIAGYIVLFLLTGILLMFIFALLMLLEKKRNPNWSYETRYDDDGDSSNVGIPILLVILLCFFGFLNFLFFSFLEDNEDFTFEEYNRSDTYFLKKEKFSLIPFDNKFNGNDLIFIAIDEKKNEIEYEFKSGDVKTKRKGNLEEDYYFYNHKEFGEFREKHEVEITDEDEIEIIFLKKNYRNNFIDWYLGNKKERKIIIRMPSKYVR